MRVFHLKIKLCAIILIVFLLITNILCKDKILSFEGGISKTSVLENDELSRGYNLTTSMVSKLSRFVSIGAKLGYSYFGDDADLLENFNLEQEVKNFMSFIEFFPIIRVYPIPTSGFYPNIFFESGIGLNRVTIKSSKNIDGILKITSLHQNELGMKFGMGVLLFQTAPIGLVVTSNVNLRNTKYRYTKYFTLTLGIIFNK